MIIYEKGLRKDGKIKVEYVFPDAGKRITKIVTREELDAKYATLAAERAAQSTAE